MKRVAIAGVLVALSLVAAPLAAQESGTGEEAATPEMVREAMLEYFQSRLRADLGLTDAQVEAVGPLIQQLERAKADARRQRQETVRRLRRGVERGASDAELERLLKKLDDIEWNQRVLERDTLAEIDGELTARQRVRLRFFMPRFRKEMMERIRELRGDRQRPGERRFPRQRRRGERP